MTFGPSEIARRCDRTLVPIPNAADDFIFFIKKSINTEYNNILIGISPMSGDFNPKRIIVLY